MTERPAVFTCIGDETPNLQMTRAMRDALLLMAEDNDGSIDFECRDAIGLTGTLSYDVNTGRLTVTAHRTGE